MTPKSFVMLVGATAVGLAAALGAVVVESRSAIGAAEIDQPLFPELVARANEVAVLRFRAPNSESTIVLDGDGWGFLERARYPVPTDNVRTVVAGIASLRRFEEKTDKPDLYFRLGVQDVGAEDSNSREIVLETADGEATVETYSVIHDRAGPSFAIVMGLLDDGSRFIANTPDDPALLAEMVANDYLGAAGKVASNDGLNVFTPS